MSNSRANILNKLRAAQKAVQQVPPVEHHTPMVPLASHSPDDLASLFIVQAPKLGSLVHCPASETEALKILNDLISDDRSVLCWPFQHIPLANLEETLRNRGTAIAAVRDPSVRVGITGVDAALAATGSIVLSTGQGKHRVTSL